MRLRLLAPLPAGLLALYAACLDELPAPTTCEAPAKVVGDACVRCDEPLVFVGDTCAACPPGAQVPYTNCLAPQNPQPAGDGCYGDVAGAFTCVAGEAASCECLPEDCDEEHACFDEVCPQDVLDIDPRARCLPLPEDAIAWYGQPLVDAELAPGSCVCGCMRCATRCDGKGTIFGVYEDWQAPIRRGHQGPSVDLRGLLPETGTIGLYVRGRGWATGIATLVTSDLTLQTLGHAGYFMPFLNDFTEIVAFSAAEEAVPLDGLPAPYSWASAEESPSHVIFLLAVDGGTQTPTGGIVEIDCIVPFVIED